MAYAIDRAGFWRRVVALAVDGFVAQVVLAALVAMAFAATGGRVTSMGLITGCEMKLV